MQNILSYFWSTILKGNALILVVRAQLRVPMSDEQPQMASPLRLFDDLAATFALCLTQRAVLL